MSQEEQEQQEEPYKKKFQTQNFSNQKLTSMKMIFGGIKQSFWTWGFLNCIAQRFYLNWSLTLKTKFVRYFKGEVGVGEVISKMVMHNINISV